MRVSSAAVIVVFATYLALGLAIGLYFSRAASRGLKSYFIADKKLPWWAIAGSALGTYGGGATFIGFIGLSWKIGLSYLWTDVTSAVGVLLMAVFLVPILSRMARFTMAEPLGERFSYPLRATASFLGILRMLGVTAVTVASIADILKTFVGLPFSTAAVVAWAVLTAYVVAGGQYGIGYTDPIQGLLMVATMVAAPVALLLRLGHGSLAGGWAAMAHAVPAASLDAASVPALTMVGWITTVMLGNSLRPELFRNIFAARSSREGVLAWVGAGSALPVILLGNVLVGVIGRALITPAQVHGTDLVAPTLFGSYVPLPITVLYLAALLGTIVSTASAALMGAASHYVADFHLRFRPRGASSRQVVLLSRAAVVGMSLIALWWAVSWRSIIKIFLFSHTMVVAGILVPYAGMFFWPRITTPAALAAAVSGAMTALVWNFVVRPLHLAAGVWSLVQAAVPGLAVSIVVAVVVTYATAPEYEKALRFARTYRLNRMQRRLEAALGGAAAAPAPEVAPGR